MYPLVHLIYVSKATSALSMVCFKSLIGHARLNNAALGITGVLIHTGFHVLQVLEGNPDTVDALFERIARDTRHMSAAELVREPIETRQFQNVSLGYVPLSTGQIATLTGATDSGIEDLYLSELNVGRAKRLLAMIATGHRNHSAAVAAA